MSTDASTAADLIKEAEADMAANKYFEALGIWAKLRFNHPDEPTGWYRGAMAHIMLGEYGPGEVLCEEGICRFPNDPGSYMNYVTAAVWRRRFEEAIKRCHTLLELFPDNGWAYWQLAYSLTESGDVAGGREWCEKGMQALPNALEPLYYHAELAMREGDYKIALERWRIFREKFPDHPDGYSRAGMSHLMLGEYAKGEEICKEGMEKCPNDSGSYINYATSALWRRDFNEAEKRLKLLLDKFPDSGWAYGQMAFLRIEKGDFFGARKYCHKGIELDISCPDPYAYDAEIDIRHGDYINAQLRWQIVREKFPFDSRGYVQGSSALLSIQDYDRAERVALEGIKKFPWIEDLYITYATISFWKRDLKELIKRCENLLSKFPFNGWAYGQMAWAYTELGNCSKAREICRQGISRKIGGFSLYLFYADACLKEDDIESAKNAYIEASSNYKLDIWGATKAINGCICIGDLNIAQNICDKAVKNFPQNLELRILDINISLSKKDKHIALKDALYKISKLPFEILTSKDIKEKTLNIVYELANFDKSMESIHTILFQFLITNNK